MKTKSALSYFGSDSEVAPQLAAMLDDCRHVTIPFCGGMSILPHLKASHVVANDLNDLAINFYKTVSGIHGDKARLIEQCQHTLSHPSEIAEAMDILSGRQKWCSTDVAWAYWASCWIPRKGIGGSASHLDKLGSPSVRFTANGGANASRVRAAANDLEAWAKHFERCDWTCLDFRKLLPKCADKQGCGIYVDAPWRGADYLHKFSDQDHADLAEQLRRFKETKVVIRYGDDSYIRGLYHPDLHSWTIIEAASRTQANKATDEIWITNR